jgi:hypothetical protein
MTGRFTTVMRAGVPVIVDSVSGLEWQGGAANMPSPTTTWADMLALCEASTYGGSTDWRLPDYMEATTIALKASDLGETNYSLTYLTSSWMPSGVLAVRISDGLTEYNISPTAALSNGIDPIAARCVRGGGR